MTTHLLIPGSLTKVECGASASGRIATTLPEQTTCRACLEVTE